MNLNPNEPWTEQRAAYLKVKPDRTQDEQAELDLLLEIIREKNPPVQSPMPDGPTEIPLEP